MPIPKTIFQTYKTAKLPALTRWHVGRLKRRNPQYDYQFYDDARIDAFLKEEYGREVYDAYRRIHIGAAKADFFRYAILYKKGGIYLDIDSLILAKLDEFILPGDRAIISLESNLEYYIQFALFYEAGHPFLKETMELIIRNIGENKYPHQVHKMTGPAAYSSAIRKCLEASPDVAYRQVGVDYDRKVKFSYRMSKFFMYGLSRKNHWKKLEQTTPVLKDGARPPDSPGNVVPR